MQLPLAAAASLLGLPLLGLLPGAACSDAFEPIDPQNLVNFETQSPDDYVPLPGYPWIDPAKKGSSRTHKVALITIDYEDQPFVITQSPGSTIFGNPQPVAAKLKISRQGVPAFYRDFLNKPSDLNRNRTLHEYWMESSAGKHGVELVEFGPYRMTHQSYQYGVTDRMNSGACPRGSTCGKPLASEVKAAWQKDVGKATADGFKMIFVLSAGQCEQQTRLAFGPDRFASQKDVPDAFGPPGGGLDGGNAAKSFESWTSWASASRIWPYQSGPFTVTCEDAALGAHVHEMSHVLGLRENFPSPRKSVRRGTHVGAWSPMSRGSNNGPGNAIWHIPSLQVGSVPSSHTIREKNELFGLTSEELVHYFDSGAVAAKGPVVVNVTARTAKAGVIGTRIRFSMASSSGSSADRSPRCSQEKDVLCDGGGFIGYDLEVVDRMGADSFQSDAGVLISKYKADDNLSGNLQWVVDASAVQSKEAPTGEPSIAALRLPGALFHAGTRSGTLSEYVDQHNGLHFYVIGKHRSADGLLSYTLGVRGLEGSGPSVRGVALGRGVVASGLARDSPTKTGLLCTFELTNNGTYANKLIFRTQAQYLNSDIYRLNATVQGAGWEVALPSELAAAKFGESVKVTVAVRASRDAADIGVVTLKTTSESDRNATHTAECRVSKVLR